MRAYSDAEDKVFKRFHIEELTDTHLKAVCWGEKAEPERHRFKTDIKGITYHMLKVEEGKPSRVHVVLDI